MYGKKIQLVFPLFSLKCFSMRNVKGFHMYALMLRALNVFVGFVILERKAY